MEDNASNEIQHPSLSQKDTISCGEIPMTLSTERDLELNEVRLTNRSTVDAASEITMAQGIGDTGCDKENVSLSTNHDCLELAKAFDPKDHDCSSRGSNSTEGPECLPDSNVGSTSEHGNKCQTSSEAGDESQPPRAMAGADSQCDLVADALQGASTLRVMLTEIPKGMQQNSRPDGCPSATSDRAEATRPDSATASQSPGASGTSREERRVSNGFNLRRNRKRKSVEDVVTLVCPNCGKSVRNKDLAAHMSVDIEKLDAITRRCRKASASRPSTSSKSTAGILSLPGSPPPLDSTGRYKAYLRVQRNREKRNRAKTKRPPGPGEQETTCPVCGEHVVGSPDELAQHVDQCLRQQEEELDIEGDSNSGSDNGFEEYTWAGQTRVRATSLLEGGVQALGVVPTSSREDDCDLDLNVDGDDSDIYGASQYTEADVIPCTSGEPEEEKERRALRRAVLRAGQGTARVPPLPPDRRRWTQPRSEQDIQCDSYPDVTDSPGSPDEGHLKPVDISDDATDSSQGVINALKAKIKEQQRSLVKVEKFKCLICMEPYTRPLTSLQCWHVHCEECWLRTLGTKKLCPQCNAITSPSDLRRVYL